MAQLDRIRIAGFKPIRDQDLELGCLNVLIGANGAGKSNLLTAFRLLHQIDNIYHFHDTSDSAKIRQPGDVGDNRFLRSDAGNLAAFLYRLQEASPGHYANIVDVVKMVAPFFGGFKLGPDRLNPKKIKLKWRENGSDSCLDAHLLSDGTLRFICLATLLLQPELPSAVLLDEPELGLHPYAIGVLTDLLRSAAERTQILVSTQSATLVNQLSPEDVIVVDRLSGNSSCRRLSSDEIASWLEEYALGDLWEKNVLGGRPRH